MTHALLGHLFASSAPDSSDPGPLRDLYSQVSKVPAWQMMILAVEDSFRHVHLQSHQRDKSIRADYLADEVMVRFARKLFASPESLTLFKEAEQLTINLSKIHQGLEQAIKGASSFPEHATHPRKFLDASSFMLIQTRGFLTMQNSVKSGTSQLRQMLYPEPPQTRTTALNKFLAANIDQDGECDRIREFSDVTLSVKVLQMTSTNELARPGSMVYGTSALKVYLPMMLTGLLEGVSAQSEKASLEEYVDSARQMISHLQRCQRQVDLLNESGLHP